MTRAVDHHHVEEALESGTAEAVLMLTTSPTTDQDALPTTVKQAYKAAEDNTGSTSPVSMKSFWAKHRRAIIGAAVFCTIFLVLLVFGLTVLKANHQAATKNIVGDHQGK
jgi:hypothetical protein